MWGFIVYLLLFFLSGSAWGVVRSHEQQQTPVCLSSCVHVLYNTTRGAAAPTPFVGERSVHLSVAVLENE